VFGVVARIEPCSQGHMQVLIDDLADRSRIASQV
jgi:iron complex transport system ATP-binding protein